MRKSVVRCRGIGPLARTHALAVAVSLVIPTLNPAPAQAATKTWNVGTGVWSTPANWSVSGVPGAGDVVNIVNNDTVSRTITYDYTNGAAVTLATFTLDQTGTGANKVNMTANTLITTNDIIGNNGVGNFSQSGGTHTVNANFTLGNATTSASLGIYLLSGGNLTATNATATALIGNNGAGNFSQSGGNATFSSLTVANGTSSNSLLALSAGNLSVTNTLIVGNNGNGTMNQSGTGLATIGNLTVANGTSSNNIYTFSSGTLNVTVNAIVGNNGTASFTQSNAAAATFGNLTLAGNLGSNATYTFSSGTLLVNTNSIVGNSSQAVFNQTGGNQTVNGSLTIGNNASSSGCFTLGAGNLTVNGITNIGNIGNGTFNQTGGTFITNGAIMLGSGISGNGLMTLSGGTTTTPILYAGGNNTVAGNTGTVTVLAGGNLNITGLLRVYDSGITFFNLAGGNVSVANIDMQGQPGRFNWTSGHLTITASYSTNGFAIIDSPSADIGNIGTDLILSANIVLATNGGLFVGNTGVGNLTITGGTQTIADIVNVSASSGSQGTVTMTNGTLAVNGAGQWQTEFIGRAGFATFNQTGGSHLVGSIATPYNVLIGALTGAFGSYNLAGGIYNITGNAYVGGTSTNAGGGGVLDISGGNMTVTGGITVYNSNGTALVLEGGTLNTATLTLINPNKFSWSAGTLNLTNQGVTVDNGGLFGNTLSMQTGQILIAALGVTNNGTINFSGGAINSNLTNNAVIAGFGSFGGASTFINNGFITQGNGTLLFGGTGGSTNANTIQGAPARIIQIANATFTNNGAIQLAGAFLQGNGTLNNSVLGTITGPGTISIANFSNSGLIEVDSGLLTIPNFLNNGTVQLGAGTATLGSANTVTNAGTIQGIGRITAGVNNTTGTIEAIGGTLNIAGALTNSVNGTIRTSAGTKILVSGGSNFPTNAGLISLAGGTFDTSTQTLNNTGQITGYGILSTGGLTNNGAVTLTGGTTTVNGNVTNAVGKTLNVKDNPAVFTGFVTNNGTIKITNTKVTFTGGYSGANYMSDPSTNVFQGNITISPGGTMSGSAGDQFILSGAHFNIAGTFSNGGLLQSSSLTNNSGNFIQTGSLIQSANFTNSGAATISGNQSWSNGAVFSNTAGNASFQSDSSPSGPATLNVNVSGGNVTFSSHHHLAALNISGSGIVTIAANGTTHSTLFVPSLSFGGTTNAWTGKLDIGANGLVVQATDANDKAAKLALLGNQIASGQNGGDWLGQGITSSVAQANPIGIGAKAVALFDNASLNLSSLYGASTPLDSNSILIFTALSGDANFDGKVNIDDLTVIANHWQGNATNWFNGDFNGDQFVDVNDLTIVANNWQAGTTPGFTGQSFADALAEFPSLAGQSVPEPAAIALLGLAAPFLIHRRRSH